MAFSVNDKVYAPPINLANVHPLVKGYFLPFKLSQAGEEDWILVITVFSDSVFCRMRTGVVFFLLHESLRVGIGVWQGVKFEGLLEGNGCLMFFNCDIVIQSVAGIRTGLPLFFPSSSEGIVVEPNFSKSILSSSSTRLFPFCCFRRCFTCCSRSFCCC